MSGCPFGGRRTSSTEEAVASPRPLQEINRDAGSGGGKAGAALPTGRARIRLLYEEYVHLPLLRQVWEAPSTEKPVLEPVCAAAFHAIELAFLLLAEFISDDRRYVAKRPRVELVADDIATQCQLLTELVDAELEEELQEGCTPDSRLSLTQPFPFEGCPPTKAEPCHSPGLQHLIDAIQHKVGDMTAAERNSVIKLVLNITAAFASFQRWTVGLGIEHQLNALREAVGLPTLQYPHRLNLDYDSLVKPWLCEQTLTCETYTHAEDFFFRTIHLGTDCWAFVALSRLHSAQQLAAAENWHVAATRATQASRILHYLGSHVMLLTSMNLRDYLYLKVEVEGTSGEGSVQVKSFRPTVTKLFQPLVEAVLGAAGAPVAAVGGAGFGASGSDEEQKQQRLLLQEALMRIYEFPDQQPGLYNYCKALEGLETGLLGGFYYKHYCLATNVIGSQAKGTMQRAVQALKGGYETPVFPLLDRCRVALGARIDAEVAHNKGRMMQDIMRKYQQQQQQCGSGSGSGSGTGGATASGLAGAGGAVADVPAARGGTSSGGGPFGFSSSAPAVASDACFEQLPTAASTSAVVPAAATAGAPGSATSSFEAARQRLYSWQDVPPAFQQMVAAEVAQQVQQLGLVAHPPQPPAVSGTAATAAVGIKGSTTGVVMPLAFLDHAWGQMAPLAQYRAWREAAALYQLGNSTWDVVFGRVMPQAAVHIRALLGLPANAAACTVQFGSNSHELVGRLLSVYMDRRSLTGEQVFTAAAIAGSGSSGAEGAAVVPPSKQAQGQVAQQAGQAGQQRMRVLTSDTEFYSITRQLNRFVEAGVAEVDVVPAEPAATFCQRACTAVAAAAAGRQYDVVYLSQTTYLTQRTLIPNIPELVRGVRVAAAVGGQQPAEAGAAGGLHGKHSSGGSGGNAADGAVTSSSQVDQQRQPLLIIDGYHGFCALPTDLGEVAEDCCYVAGMLKHAGCGANCAFMTLPTRLGVRPVLTGWLADPTVLAPGSSGIQVGSQVGYFPELALQGGTPAFLLPLLTFNHLMQLWEEAQPAMTVGGLHRHVTTLHRRFLDRLDAAAHPSINTSTLLLPQDAACRSHTLVFAQPDAAAAKAGVEGLAARGVQVDCRKVYVRFGFGANHSMADVDALLAALRAAAEATS